MFVVIVAGCSGRRDPIPVPTYAQVNRADEIHNERGRDNERISLVVNVDDALKRFQYDTRLYPRAPEGIELGTRDAVCLTEQGFVGQTRCTIAEHVYLSGLALNPTPGGRRMLYRSKNGSTFQLFFGLERGFLVPDGANIPVPFTTGTAIRLDQNLIGPGTHILTPEGIDPDLPDDVVDETPPLQEENIEE